MSWGRSRRWPLVAIGQAGPHTLELEFNGYPVDHLDTLLDCYGSIAVAEVQRVARRYLHPDATTIFSIGDAAKFEPAMRTFGPVHRPRLNRRDEEHPTFRDGNLSITAGVRTDRRAPLFLQQAFVTPRGDHI